MLKAVFLVASAFPMVSLVVADLLLKALGSRFSTSERLSTHLGAVEAEEELSESDRGAPPEAPRTSAHLAALRPALRTRALSPLPPLSRGALDRVPPLVPPPYLPRSWAQDPRSSSSGNYWAGSGRREAAGGSNSRRGSSGVLGGGYPGAPDASVGGNIAGRAVWYEDEQQELRDRLNSGSHRLSLQSRHSRALHQHSGVAASPPGVGEGAGGASYPDIFTVAAERHRQRQRPPGQSGRTQQPLDEPTISSAGGAGGSSVGGGGGAAAPRGEEERQQRGFRDQ